MPRRATFIITALALGVLPLLAPSAASAAGLPTTVSIQVSLVYSGQARTFSVTDAPVGDGPELTIADQTANPGFCGYVDVDVDNVAETITVTGHEADCYFDTATVTVTGTGIDTIAEVSNGAFLPEGECSIDSAASITSPGTAEITWSDPGGCTLLSTDGGVSSYTYTATAPTTSTTESPTTTSAPPTSTTAAPAVAAVVVTPAFTG